MIYKRLKDEQRAIRSMRLWVWSRASQIQGDADSRGDYVPRPAALKQATKEYKQRWAAPAVRRDRSSGRDPGPARADGASTLRAAASSRGPAQDR